MGVVYLARDPEQRSVAVKILRPAVAGDPNARRRLAREVETMRRVRSPFVAEVLDTDVTSETPYIVTRYVPGRTLDEVVTQEGPLSGARLIRLAAGLADALAAIHAAGVVHRDLKPGNVMLMNGDPVVIDFGIAQALDSTRLTMTGMFMGTPGYLSPEVIEGQNSTSFSDVHAWGATVAFAATGRPPFGTGSYETIFYRIVNGKPDLSGVPAPMAELLAAALRRDPAQRPAAIQLRTRAAALDPAVLQPLAVPAGLQGMGLGGPGTRADRPALRPTALDGFGGPGGTMVSGGGPGRHHVPAAGPGDGPVRDPADRRRAGPRRRLRGHPPPGDLPAGPAGRPSWRLSRPGRQFRPSRVAGARRAGRPGGCARGGPGRGPLGAPAPAADPGPGHDGARGEPRHPAAGGRHPDRAGRAGAAAGRGPGSPWLGPAGCLHVRRHLPLLRAPLADLHRGAGTAGADRGRRRSRRSRSWPCRPAPACTRCPTGRARWWRSTRTARGRARRAASSTGSGARRYAAPACRRWRCSECARSRSAVTVAAVTSPAAFWPLATPSGTLVHLPTLPGLLGRLHPGGLRIRF